MAGGSSNPLSQPITTATMNVSPVRDDRIAPLTKWVVAIIVPFLVVAFIMLYFFPDNTKELFAWTINPRMTPLLMGAGYIAGAYFFIRAIFDRRWHHIAIGFLPVTTFAGFMLIATLLHLDKFNFNHISFYAWIILYAITPFIVLGVWLYNRRTDPGTLDPDDLIIPANVRLIMGIAGGLILLTGIILMLFPAFMISIWPWNLTPLTARVVGGWFALPGVFGLAMAMDRRWSAARFALQSQFLGILLILIGVVRAWENFHQDNPLTWVFVGGMLFLLVGIALFYFIMENARHKSFA